MTELTTIRHNHLALDCRACGRWRLVPVADLIARVGGHRSPHWVAERSVCSQCGSRGASFQITYVGQSWRAMEGARSDKDGDA